MMARSTRDVPRPAREKPTSPRPARAKPTPSATPKPDFAKYKDIITDLYWRHESMSLKRMAEVMAKEHNFFATERQYKRKFSDWGLGKNITKKESEAMYRLQKIRRRHGKESVFYRDGLLLDSTRVSRSFRNHKFAYEPRDDEVELPPTIRCETPKPQERRRVLPNEEEAPITSPQPQPASSSPSLLHEQRLFPEHGPWARPLSPQDEWDITDHVSFGDMLAAPAQAGLGRQSSAAPVNHFAFDDPGPYPDFLADFEATSSSGFGNTMASGLIPHPAQHGGFMRSSPGWGTGNYDPHPSQGNTHFNTHENGLFNNALHTWPPSPAHTFTTPSFNPPFNAPPTPPPNFDLPAPPFHPPPTPPPTFDFPPTWTSPPHHHHNARAPVYQPTNPPRSAYPPTSTINPVHRGLGGRG